MSNFAHLESISKATEAVLHPPFRWCHIQGGKVFLENATQYGGSRGGPSPVCDFAIAKYPITNAQYEKFLKHLNGFSNPQWWEFSPEAVQWRKDHKNPKPTAFNGPDLPRTRVSWFDSVAFSNWLSAELEGNFQYDFTIRLPTEQEWQRAALGDTGWCYPWGDRLSEARGNYGNLVGYPSRVGNYPEGISGYGVLDMIGNVWEWCLTGWNQEKIELGGYTYRVIKGGAWNINNPDHLCANDRGCHPPRGRLNDCGFRVLLDFRNHFH